MKDGEGISSYASYMSLGLEIAVGMLLPILAGYWLDDYFGISPWLLLAGCLIGIVNIFSIIFRLSKRLKDES